MGEVNPAVGGDLGGMLVFDVDYGGSEEDCEREWAE